MKTITAILMLLMAWVALPVCAGADTWQALFDGKGLDGWIQRGGKAEYTVSNGCVVGTTVPRTPNSFLCTARDYTNFVLELEFKVDPSLNSGIQFRSHSLPSFEKGRVHGCQYEIDMDPVKNRWWAGGLYEEGRRGWLFPGTHGGEGKVFTTHGRPISKTNDWNRVRIEANGPRIRTWLNDAPRVECTDAKDASGFIALQVHSVVGNPKPMAIMWRNIKIQELPAAPPKEDPKATSVSHKGLPFSPTK